MEKYIKYKKKYMHLSDEQQTIVAKRILNNLRTYYHNDANIRLPESIDVPYFQLDFVNTEYSLSISYKYNYGETALIRNGNVINNDEWGYRNPKKYLSVLGLINEITRVQYIIKLCSASQEQEISRLKQELKATQEQELCSICMERKKNRLLIPCGHRYCNECVSIFKEQKCPECHSDIQSSNVAYGGRILIKCSYKLSSIL